jgi:hypothetical protein
MLVQLWLSTDSIASNGRKVTLSLPSVSHAKQKQGISATKWHQSLRFPGEVSLSEQGMVVTMDREDRRGYLCRQRRVGESRSIAKVSHPVLQRSYAIDRKSKAESAAARSNGGLSWEGLERAPRAASGSLHSYLPLSASKQIVNAHVTFGRGMRHTFSYLLSPSRTHSITAIGKLWVFMALQLIFGKICARYQHPSSFLTSNQNQNRPFL